MKIDAINFKLQELLDEFLTSIKDNVFPFPSDSEVNTVQRAIYNGYIAGGCFASMMLREEPSDYDFYFNTEADADIFKQFALTYLKDRIVFESPNALTFDNKFQFMLKHYGNPNAMVNSFDFEHLKIYKCYNSPINLYRVNGNIYKILLEKHLLYSGSKYPLASLMRVRKYIKRGWFIPASQMLSIVFDIMAMYNILDENPDAEYNKDTLKLKRRNMEIDVDTLVEQMMGIDPLTIMAELSAVTGQRISFDEVINLINKEKP